MNLLKSYGFSGAYALLIYFLKELYVKDSIMLFSLLTFVTLIFIVKANYHFLRKLEKKSPFLLSIVSLALYLPFYRALIAIPFRGFGDLIMIGQLVFLYGVTVFQLFKEPPLPHE